MEGREGCSGPAAFREADHGGCAVEHAGLEILDLAHENLGRSGHVDALHHAVALQDERLERAKGMDEELRKLDADINAKKLSLSEEKLGEMQKALADKRIAMQRYAQDADREIGEARDRELQALEQKIKPVIDAIGKEMGLAAIFNKFESGLVYASEAIDITDTVVQRFNAAQPAAAAAKK